MSCLLLSVLAHDLRCPTWRL